MADLRKGPDNPRWRGGRYIRKDGYVHIRVNGIRMLEHRHVMSQILGRALTREEVVHHKNGNPSDNRPKNLELLESKALHNRLHWSGEERAPSNICKVCGSSFRRHYTEQPTCSPHCGRKLSWVIRRPKLKSRIKNCTMCNNEFLPKHPKQVCCSRYCGVKLGHKRRGHVLL
jgi:hypothetical protein